MDGQYQILKPYQIFDPIPALAEIEANEQPAFEETMRDVIMLSGPPGAGKSHVARKIKDLIGDNCGIVTSSAAIYGMMSLAQLPETHLPYDVFKALPLGRERIIAAAAVFRKHDEDIFCRFNVQTPMWRDKALIVVDNVGFDFEVQYFKRFSTNRVLLEIMYPFGHRGMPRALLDEYCKAFIHGGTWPGDSRYSLVTGTYPMLQRSEVASYIDSDYMMDVLNRRAFFLGDQPSRLESTTLGKLHDLYVKHWTRPAAPAAYRDLFAGDTI